MSIDLYSPWIVVAALTLALSTTALLAKWQPLPASNGRFASIDGLRGFLAFFVFLHHGSIWFVQLHEQKWVEPSSNLYRHLGDSSVALFFMITAFLFTTKILTSNDRPIDWIQLYASRITRLFPLYAFAIALLWLMAWAITNWTLQVPPNKLLAEIFNWLAFTIPHGESVNGLKNASQIIAGVTWSLPYEWWFYCCLPALAFTLRKQKSHFGWVLFGLLNLILFKTVWQLGPRVMPFIGGILAAYIVRNQKICTWACKKSSGVIVIACLVLSVTLTPTAYTPQALVLLSIAFIFIACGNDIFGLLSAAPSRMLGEITYSIYLLHGLILYFVFRWIISWPSLVKLSPAEYWGIVLVMSIPLVVVCYITYRCIELPAQKATPVLARWILRLGHRQANTRA